MNVLTPVTCPEQEPLSLEEVKLHLRVDSAVEDDLISSLIKGVRMTAEERCGRALMPQTWLLNLDSFPCGSNPIILPLPPFKAIVEISYLNMEGETIICEPSTYRAKQANIYTNILPAFGMSWPVALRDFGSVSIVFEAGYADANAVPSPIKSWMKTMIATLWENREAIVRGEASSATFLPRSFVDGLLDPYLALSRI